MRSIRNVGFFGQGKSGKTTLAEALLFKAGIVSRLGSVLDGNATLDFDPEEIKRQCSINLGLGYLDWKKVRVNLFDAPGYADFMGEACSALAAVDFGVVVIPADGGLGVGTDNAWKMLQKADIPAIFFVSRAELATPDLTEIARRLSVKWSARVVPWTAREVLEEAVAESDDALLNKYLEEGKISEEEFRGGLKQSILSRQVFPLLAGSAVKDQGLEELLDFFVDFLPEYQDLPPVKAAEQTWERKEKAPLLLRVFKTTSDPYVGRLSYFKVVSGALSSNSTLVNLNRSARERVGLFSFVQGKKQEPADKGVPGDILSVAKLNVTRTGDTLAAEENMARFPEIDFPRPSISVSVTAREKGAEDKLGSAFGRIMEEEPTIRIARDAQTGETIMSGLGDLQLDIWLSRLAGRFGVQVNKGVPRIAYLETVTAPADGQGKFKRQTGGHGQYGDCHIKVEPLERGAGFEFVNAIVGGVIPRQYIPSVEKGVKEAMSRGVLAHYPLTDIKVTLHDGSFHPVDSSDIAFQIAGSMAMKKVAAEAKPALLEPIMSVEITVPKEQVGDIIGDINSRRGRVLNMDAVDSENQEITAQIPLAEMANYATSLRSMTSGRAGHQAQLLGYDFVPFQQAEKIVSERQKEVQDEHKE